MKHLFIINPVAGKGRALQYIPEIKKIFSKKTDDIYFIETTEGPGHATELVRRYVEKDTYRVYSVGGDGTLNEVLNGIAGSESSLAGVPAGSGNDFVRSLEEYDLNATKLYLLESLINGKEKIIDIGKINDRYFINISSVGFDAEVVYHANKLKKIPFINGLLAYTLGVFLTLINYGNNIVNITIDGNSIETDILLVAVANGKYYGGGMQPVPTANIQDGLFDICLIRSVRRLKIVRFLSKFIKGQHATVEEVSFHTGKEVKLVPHHEIALNIDGEISLIDHEVVFKIVPNAVKIVVPATSKSSTSSPASEKDSNIISDENKY